MQHGGWGRRRRRRRRRGGRIGLLQGEDNRIKPTQDAPVCCLHGFLDNDRHGRGVARVQLERHFDVALRERRRGVEQGVPDAIKAVRRRNVDARRQVGRGVRVVHSTPMITVTVRHVEGDLMLLRRRRWGGSRGGGGGGKGGKRRRRGRGGDGRGQSSSRRAVHEGTDEDGQ